MIHPADILVIDDSPTVRRMIELILSREGHRVRTTEDGAAGVTAARESRPDLILVDYMMPNMNGAQFCEIIRGDANLSDVPIILISSKGQAIGDAFERRFGVVESFTKPFEPEELIAKIAAFLPISLPPIEGEIDAATGLDVSPDALVERFDRIVRDYFHARFPAVLKTLIGDTLREQGVTPSVGMTLNGCIGAIGVPDVLNMLASNNATGRMSVIGNETFGEIFIENGLFVFATISRKTGKHRFLTDIIKEKTGQTINPGLVLEVTAESQQTGRPMGSLLVDRGVIDKDSLAIALRAQGQEAMNACLELKDGEFSFDSQPVPSTLDDIETRIPMVQALMDGLRQLDERQNAARRLPSDDIVLTRYIANEYAEDTALDGRELTAFLAIDGKRSVAQLAQEIGCSTAEFKELCIPLIKAGMVRVPQRQRESVSPQPQGSTPSPANS